ncbi:MAG: HEPN domain-containing protein [Candidatus Gracilibacteria bacterium]|nr:HEPN domain-containing protein [Candidatus Gracilibacteria bacterium]
MQSKFDNFELSIKELIDFAKSVQSEILNGTPSYTDNTQFYTKSLLIMGCIYLETYLKELGYILCDDLTNKVQGIKIPKHIIDITAGKDLKGKNTNFVLNFTHDNIDKRISGNVSKTIDLFGLFLVNLTNSSIFNRHKSTIESYVQKRNEIIHQNNIANNVSIGDIIGWLEQDFLPYAESILRSIKRKYP